jgi:glycosyltransferase involved in cell wall biosynthesis
MQPMSERPSLIEIMSGLPRPRHLRFAEAINNLVPGAMIERRYLNRWHRLHTNAGCYVTGIRQVGLSRDGTPTIVHQALADTTTPHAVEYDVPHGLHGYSYSAYLRHGGKARSLLENPAMRMLFVFSEWAKRSFALHFGEEVAARCRIAYPLASSHADDSKQARRYDFTFIATSFRAKGGPELLRAFRALRHSIPNTTMCVVTNMAEAKSILGDLAAFPGVEWREANLDENGITALLADTHCLVHPTLWDSFGVVVMEALAAGCAIITSKMASLPEMVTPENGILLDLPAGLVVGDLTIPQFSNVHHFSAFLSRLSLRGFERDLTAAMAEVVGDMGRRANYQQAARELYRRRFSRAAWDEQMRVHLREAFPNLQVRCDAKTSFDAS